MIIPVLNALAGVVVPGAMMGAVAMEQGVMKGGVAFHLQDNPAPKSVRIVGFVEGSIYIAGYTTYHGDSGRLISLRKSAG